jgi:hypothetical protein
MKVRAMVIGVMVALAIVLYSGFAGPISYKICAMLLTIGFFGLIEGLLYVLPNQGRARLAGLWLVALAAPPVWSGLGMSWLFSGLERFASWDVALPWFWMACVAVLYVHAVTIAVVETIRSRW